MHMEIVKNIRNSTNKLVGAYGIVSAKRDLAHVFSRLIDILEVCYVLLLTH